MCTLNKILYLNKNYKYACPEVCDYVTVGQNNYGMSLERNKTTNYENSILVW